MSERDLPQWTVAEIAAAAAKRECDGCTCCRSSLCYVGGDCPMRPDGDGSVCACTAD